MMHIVIMWLGLHPVLLHGQNAYLDADTNALDIGAQTDIRLRFEPGDVESFPAIDWPHLNDTLPGGVEILEQSSIDTVRDEPPALEQTFTVTYFDTGYVVIEPIPIQFDGSRFETNPLLLYVAAPELDPSAEAKDIKDIRATDYTLLDLLIDWWFIPAGVLLATLVILLLFRLKRRDVQTAPAIEPEPVDTRPAHVIALEALAALESKQLCSKQQFKEYHTELTDILRSYLERRYAIAAHERTTHEITAQMRALAMTDDARETLLTTLRLADVVKFAKYRPEAPENEQVMRNAYQFIEATAIKEEEAQ